MIEEETKKVDEQGIISANLILSKNLASIRTVTDWSKIAGYSSSKQFCLQYRKHHGKNCKEAMVEIRILEAIGLLKCNPEIKLYTVAIIVGIRDEYALYKYFMRHTGMPPSHFREKSDRKKG